MLTTAQEQSLCLPTVFLSLRGEHTPSQAVSLSTHQQSILTFSSHPLQVNATLPSPVPAVIKQICYAALNSVLKNSNVETSLVSLAPLFQAYNCFPNSQPVDKITVHLTNAAAAWWCMSHRLQHWHSGVDRSWAEGAWAKVGCEPQQDPAPTNACQQCGAPTPKSTERGTHHVPICLLLGRVPSNGRLTN